MAVATLALVGALVALYLTLYKLGYIGTLICSVGSCERVNSSRWAELFGVPVAVWGLATYLVLLALALAGMQGAPSRAVAWGLASLSGVGLVFSAWLTYLELFVIHGVCVWCVTSATIMTLIFLISAVDLRRELQAG
jgi:uncharacterized membrane protein